jgi:hypothetical protein
MGIAASGSAALWGLHSIHAAIGHRVCQHLPQATSAGSRGNVTLIDRTTGLPPAGLPLAGFRLCHKFT